jgi:GDP-4-dehydro-6-deoxy-D-mannose reductase
MRALVTGSSGFVGGHLVDHLQACGDDVVTLADGLDICDVDALTQALQAAAPEVVYHLAGWAHVGDSWRHAVEVHRVNVVGTAALLAAAEATGGSPRTLVVGSADAYGPPGEDGLPLSEATPLRPLSPYGASKAAAEVVAGQVWRSSGLPVVMTRSFNHTGPGQSPTFLVPALARRIAEASIDEHRRDVAVGNLTARRDLLDVDDVVRAYRLLALRGEPGTAYNVCSGSAVAVADVAHRLLAMAGGDLRLVQDPALIRPVEVPVLVGDNSRLRALGWVPEVTLDQTLRRVLDAALVVVGCAPDAPRGPGGSGPR